MRLTAWDTPITTPAEVRAGAGIDEDERRRRLVLALEARERFANAGELARAMGVPASSVGLWLSGHRAVPEQHVEELERIAGGDA